MSTLLAAIRDSLIVYYYGLRATLGTRLLAFMVLGQHLMKGFLYGGGASGLIGIPILFLFRSYTGGATLTATQMQLYKTAALTPWALKPLFGMVADMVYIGGRNKTPYMFVATLVAAGSCLLLACAWPIPPVRATVLLFFAFMACAIVDLLIEARYSKKMRETPERSTAIVVFVWAGIFLAQMLSTIVATLFLDNLAPHWVYLLAVPFLLALLYPIYHNWLGEPIRLNSDAAMRATDCAEEVEYGDDLCACGYGCGYFTYRLGDEATLDEYEEIVGSDGESHLYEARTEQEEEEEEEAPRTPIVGVDCDKLVKRRRELALAALITLISLTTFGMGLAQVSSRYLFAVSVVGALAMVVGFNALVGGTMARIQTFVIIQNMCTISVESAAFFFFTDDATAYPEGPHFSIPFYVSALGIVGSLCGALGMAIYQATMSEWKYRYVIVFNNLLFSAVSLLNIVVYKRWNVGYVPDQVFVMGAEVFQVIVAQWTHIPMTVALSQLCPSGVEATVFALLAGSSNLGASLAQYQGVFIMDMLQINPRGAPGESGAFANLWLASLITTLAPLVPLCLVFWLIPDAYQHDSLLENEIDLVAEARRQAEEYVMMSKLEATITEEAGESGSKT